MSTERQVKALENEVERLASEARALRERIGRTWDASAKLVPLTTPLVHDDFDGDALGDVSTRNKIENYDWSPAVPSNAKALLVTLETRDSGSAATAGLRFNMYSSTSISKPSLVCSPSGKANDDWAFAAGLMPCEDGDTWYSCNASGANTMDVRLRVWGYLI